MYCNNCGKKLSKEDFFCSNCGTPVLRQNLFDNQDEEDYVDSFEETRLFTAEELGKYLDEGSEEDNDLLENYAKSDAPIEESYRPTPNSSSVVEDRYQPDVIASTEDMNVNSVLPDAPKKAGGFGAFVGGMKELLRERKDADEDQEGLLEEPADFSNYQVEESAYIPEPMEEEEVLPLKKKEKKAKKEKKQSSFKKIVLPVILLGLIIGFVIGLILVQPWNNVEDTESNDADNQQVVATIAFTE